jgi:hypothetical protein
MRWFPGAIQAYLGHELTSRNMRRHVNFVWMLLALALAVLSLGLNAQDIIPRVFVVNHDFVDIYPTMEEVSGTSSSLRISKAVKGDLIVGYQPASIPSVSWIEVIHPYFGYIMNKESNGRKSALLELNTDIDQCDKKSQYIASHRLLTSCGFSRSWLNQWPIGNGMLGALVGGSLAQEVVPLSISDLYVYNRADLEESYRISTTTKSSIHDLTSPAKHHKFKLARQALNSGKFNNAYDHMNALRGGGLGKFEYVADLALIYLLPKSYGQLITRSKIVSSGNPGPTVIKLQGRVGVAEVMDHGGRDELLKSAALPMRKISDLDRNFRLDMANNPTNSIIALTKHLSILQLSKGIATSLWLVPIPTQANGTETATTPIIGLDLHKRQWLASEVDDVIVGNLSCIRYRRLETSPYTNARQSTGCLNILWKFSRDAHGRSPDVEFSSNVVRNITMDGQFVTQHRLGMMMVTNSAQFVPPTYACVAIHCFQPPKYSGKSPRL